MYEPTFASVTQHPLPAWYQDAKFGIFIHWTISSVPAYAPTGLGDINQIFARKSQRYAYAHQPYAEWYQNSLRIPGSPVSDYHRKTYGETYPYEDFARTFNAQSRSWDPHAWTELFSQAGARYAVLVTKHHDGFLLWDSRTPNPLRPDYRTARNMTGELAAALRERGIKLGLYYSSALDWTFTSQPIYDFADLLSSGPASLQYRRYVEAHWKELIERYDPWILWSDIGYPPGANLAELFAAFYNHNPQGVVNDRWFQLPKVYNNPLGKLLLKGYADKLMKTGTTLPKVPHCDFRTAEYQNPDAQMPEKWEAVRGIGNSFAYNQFEGPEDYLKAPDLVRMLADVVSKNGNLLLNVGPRPDGSIPEPQAEALRGIGAWLAANGEAIYGTRCWLRAKDETADGLSVRYTARDNCLYVILLRQPKGALQLSGLPVGEGSRLTLLETGEAVAWQKEGDRLQVSLPGGIDQDRIPVLRLENRREEGQ
jgi:alpha-L-fucosidase